MAAFVRWEKHATRYKYLAFPPWWLLFEQQFIQASFSGLKSPGSVIKCAARRQGSDSQEDTDYAAVQLAIAAAVWNKADVDVTFEWVHLAKDATFVRFHAGKDDGTLAMAFFPNSDAFAPDWKPYMWKVLTHELGHVLGIRHEFAIEGNPFYSIKAG
ncbi:hypothetical protein QQX98_004478 [Neonectria punicea]|uniref:Peptidase M10 metallopeptidase domain-containing protein n=1 Tax=Neonectria punicea TaxID=979145 RepID=A0ABR1H958_9HYPO